MRRSIWRSGNYRVSKKTWTYFEVGIISLSRNLSKILYGKNKMILLCSGKDFIYSSTSTGSGVMASNCIYDIILFSSALLKTEMAFREKTI